MSSRFSSYSSYSSYPSYSRSSSTSSPSSYLNRSISTDRPSYGSSSGSNYYSGYLKRQSALPPRPSYTSSYSGDSYRSSRGSNRSSPARTSSTSSTASSYKPSNYGSSTSSTEPRSTRYSYRTARDSSSSRDSGYGSSSYPSNRYSSSYENGKDSSSSSTSSSRKRTDSVTSINNEEEAKPRAYDRIKSYETPKDPEEDRINERRKRLGLSPVRVSKSRSPIPPRYGQKLENGDASGCSGGSISSSYKSSYDSSITPTIDAIMALKDMAMVRRRTDSASSDTKEEKKPLASPLLDRKPPPVVRREKPSYSSYRRETTPEKEYESKNDKNYRPSIKVESEPSVVENDSIRSRESGGSLRSRERRDRVKDRIASRLANELDGVQTSSLPASSQTQSSGSTGGFSESNGLVGLRNIGNTCFLNSVTQCLSNIQPLIEYLVKEGISSCDINTSTSSMKGELIKAFAILLNELWRGNSAEVRCPINTSAFKTQLQRFAPQFIGYAQHDAQEFLRKLLEGLHEDVNRVTTRSRHILEDIDDNLDDRQKATESWKRYLRYDDSRIVDMFVGQLMSCLKCSHCGYRSVTFDPFWDLSLPIPPQSRQVKIQQCLELFTKEEVLDGDERPTCSKCKERRRMTKHFSIQRFPKILVLHLKRFSPHERWRGKLTCNIDFPLDGLDLSTFASGIGGNGSGHYRLLGMANHSGTALSGHYTAYCKHPFKGQWYEYNDSRVSTIASHRVCSPEAYLLFYELKY